MAQTFQDRTGSNLNRRILKIIKREGDEITVDIRRADSYEQEGTKINAKTFNDWEKRVADAEKYSLDAKETAHSTIETANNALDNSNAASTKSTQANTNAQRALDYVNALVSNIDYSQIQGDGAPAVSFLNNSDGTKRFSFRNLKGSKGDNVYVRYSFDKITMTEEPTEETMYIGFYYGSTPSTRVEDYAWSRFWGIETITAADYAQKVVAGDINPEQMYFIEGASDGQLVVTYNADAVRYTNTDKSGNKTTITVQQAIDELKANPSISSFNDLKDIPTNASYTLAGLSEKSYNSLTDKPTIPTRLTDLSERSYNSLTNRPTIPTRLTDLSERSYNSLTEKPTIPTRLMDLAERSYNSLTDKPDFKAPTFESISDVLGLTYDELQRLCDFARIMEYNGDMVTLHTNYFNIEN